MTLRNQHVKPEDLFWRLPNFDRKKRWNFGEDLFFWRSHHISDKTEVSSPSVLEFTKPEIRHS